MQATREQGAKQPRKQDYATDWAIVSRRSLILKLVRGKKFIVALYLFSYADGMCQEHYDFF